MPSKILQINSGPAAYRTDAMRDGRSGPGARDGTWIVVTSLLEHASLVGADGPTLVARAIEIAHEALGDVAKGRGDREWRDNRTPGDAILLLSDQAYDADAFNTAVTMLTAFNRADPGLNVVQRGRLLARRARYLSRLGRLEEARDQFQTIGRMGSEVDSSELRVRSCLGLASVAQMRGDYKAMDSLSRRALRLARRERLSYLERYARLALMIAAGTRHDFDAALFHGWAVYLASVGHPVDEGEILQSFGQLMSEAGCFSEARAAFSAVVARALPARIIVPALGGLATSAAATGRPATVRWVANQLNMLGAAGAPRYVMSLALLECSAGLARVGLAAPAAELSAKAIAIAKEHGFHEVTSRAAELSRRDATSTTVPFILRGRAIRIAGRIASMEPGQLPDEVSLMAIPA
jgi:tetratricopeptide (TPR) repeat protein